MSPVQTEGSRLRQIESRIRGQLEVGALNSVRANNVLEELARDVSDRLGPPVGIELDSAALDRELESIDWVALRTLLSRLVARDRRSQFFAPASDMVRRFARPLVVQSRSMWLLVVSLGLGLGGYLLATSVAASADERLLAAPDRESLVSIEPAPGSLNPGLSAEEFDSLARAVAPGRLIAAVAGFQFVDLVAESQNQLRLSAAATSSDFFSVFRILPHAGRLPSKVDYERTASPVIVLSFETWKARFKQDASIVGQTLKLDGAAYKVVGIAPRDFAFPRWAEAWTAHWESYLQSPVHPVARLVEGASLAGAEQELRTLVGKTKTSRLSPLEQPLQRALSPTLSSLTNLARLAFFASTIGALGALSARYAFRRQALAVRGILGGTPGHVGQTSAREVWSVLFVATLLGIGTAFLLWRPFLALGGAMMPLATVVQPSWESLSVAVATLGCVFGLVVAAVVVRARQALNVPLVRQRCSSRLLQSIAVPRLALALVASVSTLLVTCLVALTLEFVRVQRLDRGYEDSRAFAFWNYPAVQGSDPKEAVLFQVSTARGVHAVAATDQLPFANEVSTSCFVAAKAQPERELRAWLQAVTADYFEVMGIAVTEGRPFAAKHSEGSVILSEAVRRKLFPSADSVVGSSVRLSDGTEFEVVGVVSDVLSAARLPLPMPIVYRPLSAKAQVPFAVVGRFKGQPREIFAQVSRLATDAGPGLQPKGLQTISQLVAGTRTTPRFVLIVALFLAAVAVAAAMVSLSAGIDSAVTEHAATVALLSALGASPTAAVSPVVRHSMAPVVAGVAIGLAAIPAFTTRLLNPVLQEVTVAPKPIASAAFLVLTAAFVLSYSLARLSARDAQAARVL